MADPLWGFSSIFRNFESHFDYFEGCGGHWEHKPGISFEHNRRGSYGRGVIQHGFHTFANLATAARTGGNVSWDILNVATGSAGKHLQAMFDTWHDVATPYFPGTCDRNLR